MPVRLAVTAGTVADCSQALPLIEGIKAEHLLADKVPMKSWPGPRPGGCYRPRATGRKSGHYDRALYKLHISLVHRGVAPGTKNSPRQIRARR